MLRLYVNGGKTPVLTMPDTPEYLLWHTPERRDVKWCIKNDRGEIVDSHTPVRHTKDTPVTRYINSWADREAQRRLVESGGY